MDEQHNLTYSEVAEFDSFLRSESADLEASMASLVAHNANNTMTFEGEA